MERKIADIRKDYTLHELSENEVASDPILQFNGWFQEAVEAKVNEPNAMSLGTAVDGQPSVRIVLLKGIDEKGFRFYTNYQSAKGEQLKQNPKAALTFFWPELERQVRIEGVVEKLADEASDTYYNSRPKGSRVGAWSSPQSQVIPDREVLEERVQEYSQKFENTEEVPRPDFWGGYVLRPTMVEFWQGRPSRLHDRIRYRLSEDKSWIIERLAP
ncbi:MAG: pyridoxamine 5'-phosphate oxidase [Bacteroidota bacterium]